MSRSFLHQVRDGARYSNGARETVLVVMRLSVLGNVTLAMQSGCRAEHLIPGIHCSVELSEGLETRFSIVIIP